MKSGIMVIPEHRAKVNALIKMYARHPDRFPFPIVSHDDAVRELIRSYEEHHGEIREPVTPASAKGDFKGATFIGAEGL